MSDRLRPGDVVEVKTPDEILSTLDADGTLDHLPFMPEMIEFCGNWFRVSSRVLKTCMSGSGSSEIRGLRTSDVVTLDGLRCSGASHDGCQKECMIFWREAWLRKIDGAASISNTAAAASCKLRARLKTLGAPGKYFCQASQLTEFTRPMSRFAKLRMCWRDIRSGNCGAMEMIERIGVWLFWRIRLILLGKYARGRNKTTPRESLNLTRGEQVEVKPIREIVRSTNDHAQNRGLCFSDDMQMLCGQGAVVRSHLDKIILDGTGEMRQLRNTVYLEGATCGCAHVAFGGCPRGEYAYWREIWLRRKNNPG